MNEDPLSWPALEGWEQALGRPLHWEHGVWGKVHGAASDFRWIAHTPDFDRNVSRELRLGPEDQPRRAPLWRALPDGSYAAVSIYPSRAIDAAGRRGFLEKQVAVWQPDGVIPPVLAAFLLLPRVAQLGSELWWDRAAEGRWSDLEFHLSLPTPDPFLIPSDADSLELRIDDGLQALRDAVSPDALHHFYADLRDSGLSRPALLRGLDEPPTPHALATLLLPLEHKTANRLSLAGTLPSSRADLEDLGQLWDGLAVETALPKNAEGSIDQAEARALLDREAPRSRLPTGRSWEPPDEPAPLDLDEVFPDHEDEPYVEEFPGPGHRVPDLQPPPEEASETLRWLHQFAENADLRHIEAVEDLAFHARKDTPLTPEELTLLKSWGHSLRRRPEWADRDEWQRKASQLLALSEALAAPAAEESWSTRLRQVLGQIQSG